MMPFCTWYEQDGALCTALPGGACFAFDGLAFTPAAPAENALPLTEAEAAALAQKQTDYANAQLALAERIARQAHAGQKDKAGKDYFTAHVSVVAEIARREGCCWRVRCAAFLHDVLEDTPVTAQELAAYGVDAQVTEAVQLLTRPDGMPYEAYVERLKTNPLARAVKRCDLANNLDPARHPNEPAEKTRRRREKYANAYAQLMKP